MSEAALLTAVKWGTIGIVTLGGVVFLANRARASAGGAAADLGDAINPTSRQNLFYQGANAIGDLFNDGEDNANFNLGETVYRWVNREGVEG